MVRVPCDDCGEVTIFIKDLHVRFCLTNQHTSYWFVCPVCQKRVVSDVHETKREMLLSHPSIVTECWKLPPEETHDGPPLVLDDLLAFHERVDDAIAELLA